LTLDDPQPTRFNTVAPPRYERGTSPRYAQGGIV
jgi:hypothetical protein